MPLRLASKSQFQKIRTSFARLGQLPATVGYNAGMPPTDKPKTRSRTGPIAALVLVAVLVGYPLSEGPVLWAINAEWLPRWCDDTIYEPLFWLSVESDVFCDAMVWYLSWWSDADPPTTPTIPPLPCFAAAEAIRERASADVLGETPRRPSP